MYIVRNKNFLYYTLEFFGSYASRFRYRCNFGLVNTMVKTKMRMKIDISSARFHSKHQIVSTRQCDFFLVLYIPYLVCHQSESIFRVVGTAVDQRWRRAAVAESRDIAAPSANTGTGRQEAITRPATIHRLVNLEDQRLEALPESQAQLNRA